MVGVFRRKIAARADGKLHCLLGELPGALAAASTSGEHSLPQAYDLALSHMTFHHIADVRVREPALHPALARLARLPWCSPLFKACPAAAGCCIPCLPPHPPCCRPTAGTLRMLRGLLKPGGRVAVFDLLKEPGSDK